MVVNVASGQNGVYLMETATNPANYLRNIRFIMPGFESTYRAQPFNPAVPSAARHVPRAPLHGMDADQRVHREKLVRPRHHRRLHLDLARHPLEVPVQFANATGITPWFNIPAQAADSYVQQFAALVNQQLSPTLNFYLEYSNENWNGTFSQTAWVQAQGLAADYSTDPTLAGFYFNAVRSAKIFALFDAALSAPARMIRVMAAPGRQLVALRPDAGLSEFLHQRRRPRHRSVLQLRRHRNGRLGILGDPSTAAQVDAMSVDQVIDIELPTSPAAPTSKWLRLPPLRASMA